MSKSNSDINVVCSDYGSNNKGDYGGESNSFEDSLVSTKVIDDDQLTQDIIESIRVGRKKELFANKEISLVDQGPILPKSPRARNHPIVFPPSFQYVSNSPKPILMCPTHAFLEEEVLEGYPHDFGLSFVVVHKDGKPSKNDEVEIENKGNGHFESLGQSEDSDFEEAMKA